MMLMLVNVNVNVNLARNSLARKALSTLNI